MVGRVSSKADQSALNRNGKTADRAAPWRVVVVGDTAISREGIAAILSRDSRFLVCAAVDRPECAEKMLGLHHPDLLLLEPFRESADDFSGIKDIATQFPHTRILVISRHAEGVYVERALRAGASGYFVKSGTVDELLHAAATIASSQTRVGSRDRHRSLGNLSDRELEVLSLALRKPVSEPAASRRSWELAEKQSRRTAKTSSSS